MEKIVLYIFVYFVLIVSTTVQIIFFYNMSGKKAAIRILIYELVLITAYTIGIITIF